MSRSVHSPRPKFRKACRRDYSSEEESVRVLAKILDEKLLKRSMKANARLKKQAKQVGLRPARVYSESRAAASKKSPPSEWSREFVREHYLGRKDYG